MRTAVINKVCRIAGDAKLFLYEEDGEVKRASFIATAPVRGFEKMIVGKNPLFAVEAVMRICGLCHASHGIAASEAIENAIGTVPPRNGLLLREALGLINRIQSHLLQFLMFAGDLIVEQKRKPLILKLIDLHADVSGYLLKLGGAATHPPNLTVGGILKAPKESTIDRLRNNFSSLAGKWKEVEALLTDEDIQTDVAEELRIHKATYSFLATGLFYGDVYNLLPDGIELVPYYDFRKGEEARLSTTRVAFYMGKTVETGPRARMSVYRRFKCESLYGIHSARVEDVKLALLRLKEILDWLKPSEPFRTKRIMFGPGRGVGVYEAPRGTLVHFVELGEEGRVVSSKIVVPTMFNIPIMEEAAVGLSVRAAEAAMRLYDPCIPCTTHVVEGERDGG